jgi:cytochrome-b5 reductase
MPPNNIFQPLLRRANIHANAMSTQVAVAAAVAGMGAYALYNMRQNSAKTLDKPKPIFSSIGLHSLRLHSTELINHNTKRLRFELPDPSQPTGLSLTSALLTISFPKGRWFPVLRPYTPVSDLSMHKPEPIKSLARITRS